MNEILRVVCDLMNDHFSYVWPRIEAKRWLHFSNIEDRRDFLHGRFRIKSFFLDQIATYLVIQHRIQYLFYREISLYYFRWLRSLINVRPLHGVFLIKSKQIEMSLNFGTASNLNRRRIEAWSMNVGDAETKTDSVPQLLSWYTDSQMQSVCRTISTPFWIGQKKKIYWFTKPRSNII